MKPKYHSGVCPPYVRRMSATIFGCGQGYFSTPGTLFIFKEIDNFAEGWVLLGYVRTRKLLGNRVTCVGMLG